MKQNNQVSFFIDNCTKHKLEFIKSALSVEKGEKVNRYELYNNAFKKYIEAYEAKNGIIPLPASLLSPPAE